MSRSNKPKRHTQPFDYAKNTRELNTMYQKESPKPPNNNKKSGSKLIITILVFVIVGVVIVGSRDEIAPTDSKNIDSYYQPKKEVDSPLPVQREEPASNEKEEDVNKESK